MGIYRGLTLDTLGFNPRHMEYNPGHLGTYSKRTENIEIFEHFGTCWHISEHHLTLDHA